MISKMLWFQCCDFRSVLIFKDYDFESVITLESDMIYGNGYIWNGNDIVLISFLKWKWYFGFDV